MCQWTRTHTHTNDYSWHTRAKFQLKFNTKLKRNKSTSNKNTLDRAFLLCILWRDTIMSVRKRALTKREIKWNGMKREWKKRARNAIHEKLLNDLFHLRWTIELHFLISRTCTFHFAQCSADKSKFKRLLILVCVDSWAIGSMEFEWKKRRRIFHFFTTIQLN